MARNSRRVASLPEYMAKLSEEQSRVLRQVLALIQKSVPKSEPTISYSIPAFKLERVFLYAAAFKSHIGVFPPVRDAKLRAALKPYANAKGNLRFTLSKPIPRALIARVAKALAKQASPSPGRKTISLQAVLGRMPGATLHPMSARSGSPPLAFLYKIMGKMFAIVSARGSQFVILKCDPNLAQALRQQYKGVGHRSHLDRRYWICIDLDADVPAREVRRLVNHSYGLVSAGLTARQRAKLAELRPSKVAA